MSTTESATERTSPLDDPIATLARSGKGLLIGLEVESLDGAKLTEAFLQQRLLTK